MALPVRRYYRKLAIRAKIETVYGTDAAPTGADNAMLMSEVTVTPLEGDVVERDNIRPFFGSEGFVLAGTYARIEGSIELAGSGFPGVAPAYGPLLRACSMAETLTEATKVEYRPITDGAEAASLYADLDGVKHALLGTRGSLSVSLVPKQIPKLKFSLTGLLGPIADVALPTVDLSGFKKSLVCSNANTTFSLHGLAAVMESFNIDLGNQVEPRMLVGAESIEIVDRKMSGTAVIEAVPLATKNWYAIAQAGTTGALLAKHGTVAGNIAEIDAPAVQIGRPAYGKSQGILNTSLPLTFVAVAGGDEMVLRFR